MEVQIKNSTKLTDFPLTIVTTVNNPEIYKNNLVLSTLTHSNKIEYITLYHNYSSSTSLNTGLELASNNIVMCCHQDIYFKDNWYTILKHHIDTLNKDKQKWGVLGFAGAVFEGSLVGTHSGLSMNNIDIIKVQTLDGSILILQKKNNLKFDENLKFFHMYDADICLQALEKGLMNYCINVPINHISNRTTGGGFSESVEYIRKKWKSEFGAVHTTVGII